MATRYGNLLFNLVNGDMAHIVRYQVCNNYILLTT